MRAAKPLDVLLPAVGSAGDVHPVIGLGLALQARGHRATVVTNPFFQELIEAQSLGFLPVGGTIEDARDIITDPDLWHPRKGFEVVARRAMLPAMPEIYRHIERHAGPNTVVAASGIAFGARLAQERLGVPTTTVHLQPSIIRSLVDAGMAGNVRISASQPMWFKRAFFRLADWFLIDRVLKKPIDEFRATLGLPPVDRVLHRWMHSPQLVIGLFAEWFAPIQPDWPPQTHLVGFPLWDTGRPGIIPEDAATFLGAGAPRVVFTPGSATATLHRYFRESVAAARALGVRAMLVTTTPIRFRAVFLRTSAASGICRSALCSLAHARVSRRHRHARADDQGGHSAPRGPERARSIRQRLSDRAAWPGTQYSADLVSGKSGGPCDWRHAQKRRAPCAMQRLSTAHRFGLRPLRARASSSNRWQRCAPISSMLPERKPVATQAGIDVQSVVIRATARIDAHSYRV